MFLIFQYLYMREPWVNLEHRTVSSSPQGPHIYNKPFDIWVYHQLCVLEGSHSGIRRLLLLIKMLFNTTYWLNVLALKKKERKKRKKRYLEKQILIKIYNHTNMSMMCQHSSKIIPISIFIVSVHSWYSSSCIQII